MSSTESEQPGDSQAGADISVSGDLSVGRDFIAGDQNIQGDLVSGDKVAGDKITLGDVQGSVVAIGDGAQIIYQNVERALSNVEVWELAEQAEMRRLGESISAYISRLQKQADTATEPGGSPYKALLEYDIDDTALFYGRSLAVRQVLDMISRDQMMVLHASSGAGKTSLVKAGIIPRLLANGDVPLYVRPYNVPVDFAVKRALLPQLEQNPNLAITSLQDFLRRVMAFVGESRLVIILDQFEEFFTMQKPRQRDDFIAQLAAALSDDTLRVRWLFSMRSEWFAQLGTFRPTIRNPYANEFLLQKLSKEEAREIIVKPAERFGIGYEEGLVESLLIDLGEREIDPPQLQLVCSALFDALNRGATITRGLYEELGGTVGILRSHLDRVLTREVPAEQRPIARAVLQALVSSDQRRVRKSNDDLIKELSALRVPAETVEELCDRLLESRLLRQGEDEHGVVVYELAHDYLLDKIEIDPATQARKAAQELLKQQLDTYRRYGTLMSPEELVIIEAQRNGLVIDEESQALLDASNAKLQRDRRMVRFGIGFVILLVALAILSGVATIQAQRLAASANNQANAIATKEADTRNRLEEAGADLVLRQTEQAAAVSAAQDAGDIAATAQADASLAASEREQAQAVVQQIFEQNNLVAVGQDPFGLAWAGAESIWVANCGDNSLLEIDTRTGLTLRSVYYDSAVCPTTLLYDGQFLWIGLYSAREVQRFNLETDEIDGVVSIEGNVVKLYHDGARLWVVSDAPEADKPDAIVQVDPQNLVVVGSIEVHGEPQSVILAGGSLWIPTWRENLVDQADPETRTVIRSIEVQSLPTNLAFDGEVVWVNAFGTNKLVGIEAATGRASREIPTEASPFNLLFDGVSLWVNTWGASSAQVFDPLRGVEIARYPTGGQPTAISWDPQGGRIWVTNYTDRTAQRIHPLSTAQTLSLTTGVRSSEMIQAADALWIANTISNTVSRVDGGSEVRQYSIGQGPSDLVTLQGLVWVLNSSDGSIQSINPGDTPAIDSTISQAEVVAPGGAVAMTADNVNLWVLGRDEGGVPYLFRWDSFTGRVTAQVMMSRTPIDVLYDGEFLWVLCGDHGEVGALTKIDPSNASILAEFPTSVSPAMLGYDGTRLFVGSRGDGSGDSWLEVIDPATGAPLMDPIRIFDGPSALLWDGAHLWLASRDSNTIQEIDLAGGSLLFDFPVAVQPTGLAWDGEDLWVSFASDSSLRRYDGDAIDRYRQSLQISRASLD